MTAPVWSRVTDPKAFCAGCRDFQNAARRRGEGKIPKARRPVWQILVHATGKLVAFCGPCRSEFGNGTTR